MSLLFNLMSVVLLLIVHCSSWSLASRLGPHKNCLTCKDGHSLGVGRASRDHAGAASTTILALGEPCGVYTMSCAKGLRCVPLPREQSPLQALLQGRGFCAKQSKFSPTDRPRPTGPHPSHSGEIERAPCRKRLNTVLRGLELTIFQSDRDIYIPNCDTRGFYRKKQVCSVEIAGVSTSWATLCHHVLGKMAFYHVTESEVCDGSTALSLEEEDEEEYRERG